MQRLARRSRRPEPTRPPLAKITGALKLSSDVTVPAGSLRIELAWFAAGDSQARIIGQDIPITPVFPAAFELPLSGPPPANALWTAANFPEDAGVQWTVWDTVAPTADQSFAVAQMVAYEDLNGNGSLDLVGVDATSAPDRIVAGNLGFVLYATSGYGSDAFAPSGTAKDGYGFLVPSVTATNAAYMQWNPLSTPVSLVQTPPEWNLLMCTNVSPLLEANVFDINLAPGGDTLLPETLGPLSLNAAPIAPDGLAFPPANQPLLTCSPGGTQYCIRACPAPENQFYVCQSDDTHVDASDPSSPTYCAGRYAVDPVCYTMPSTQPAGWPCAYTPGKDCAPDPTFNRCLDAGVPPIVGDDAGGPVDVDAGSPDGG